MELNPVEEPVVLFGRISPDYLPSPEACLKTGITPRKTADGLIEAELAARIHAIMRVPGTCAVGFNSIRFDDEFIRNLFYRNFYDPYEREYRNGNSRWDVLPLLRLAHDLRPGGLEWVTDEAGTPVFRLEELTAANGIEHEHAHDALSDVEATRAIAARVRATQPKLYEFFLSLRSRDRVKRIVNLEQREPVLFNSAIFTRPEGTTSVVLPITGRPGRPHEIIAYDLRDEPDLLFSVDEAEMRRRVFTRREELAGDRRIPLVSIATNRVPAVAPLSTLDGDRARALGLSLPDIERRARHLRERIDVDPALAGRIRAVFRDDTAPTYRDPDLNIYSGGFFGDEDKASFDAIHRAPPEQLLRQPPRFADPRGPEMLLRYVARNWPEHLDDATRRRWLSHCAGRLLAPEYEKALDFETYRRRIAHRMSRSDVGPNDKVVLRDLMEYGTWLERNILQPE